MTIIECAFVHVLFVQMLLLFYTAWGEHISNCPPPLSPSAVSVATEGKHMVPVLNSLGVHLATYGNHEFGESILLSQYNDAAVLCVCQHPLSILYCLALSQYFVSRCDSVCVCVYIATLFTTHTNSRIILVQRVTSK